MMMTLLTEQIRTHSQQLTTNVALLRAWQSRYVEMLKAQHEQVLADLAATYRARHTAVDARYANQVAAADAQMAERTSAIYARWHADRAPFTWLASRWHEVGDSPYAPPPADAATPTSVCIGRLRLEGDPGEWDMPALAHFLGRAHLFIDARGDSERATVAQSLLQSILLRLALTCPPRRVQLVLCEPGSAGGLLAGFLHLPVAQRGARVLVRADELAAQLAELSEHITRVTQERLRNVYTTLEEYNAANPATAVAYRVLVMAGLPGGCDERLWATLLHIARSGPRAGVYLLVTIDSQTSPGRGVNPDDLLALASPLRLTGPGLLLWRDAELGEFAVIPDAPPPVEQMNAWLTSVGDALAQAATSLPFAQIAAPLAHHWRASSRDGLEVPIGLDSTGAPAILRLGQGVVHHALLGGTTGSGKSNLLHVLINQLALTYAPEELELYLVDFREGVEFQEYLALPHARVVAVESDREFGLSVLERLYTEIEALGVRFRSHSVQYLPDYRSISGQTLPRRLLIIDEFQVLFAENDPLAARAAFLLEYLARQGRGFGIHVLLSSQTPVMPGLYSRALYEQMGLRIAFKCSPQVSQAILGDGNSAAAQLVEPGQAISNDGLGEPGRNRELRVALLPPDARRAALAEVRRLATDHSYPQPLTFAARTPARLETNPLLQAALCGAAPVAPNLQLWLGEPVAIKPPTVAELERYDAANLLIVGGDEDQAYGLLLACLLSAAAQRTPAQVRFVVADFSRPGSPHFGLFGRLGLPHSVEVLGPRQLRAATNPAASSDDPAARPRFDLRSEPPPRLVASSAPAGPLAALEALIDERNRLLEQGFALLDAPDVLLLIAGLHAWRELQPVDYGKPSPAAAQLLRMAERGPEVGVHLLAWADGFATLEQVFKRVGLGNFRSRVLLRLSENDSNQLLSNPTAARLADQRAFLRIEGRPQGEVEKFKPYLVPDATILAELAVRIHDRMAG